MQIEAVVDTEEAAAQAAAQVACELDAAIRQRGQALVAFSGGNTPWAMLMQLQRESLDWSRVHVFQVDERWAPDGDPARNLTYLEPRLPAEAVLHPVPVTPWPSPEAAAEAYARILRQQAGPVPRLDVVHLGLGQDGHTASLVPGDPVLDVYDRDVAATGPYQGHRRVTFTYPLLDRARLVLWLICGAAKHQALGALMAGDRRFPAARVAAPRQILVADRTALGERE